MGSSPPEEKPMTRERRYRRYFIGVDSLADLLQGKVADILPDLPADAAVVDAYYVPDRRAFGLTIWSATYDEDVREGVELPEPRGRLPVKFRLVKDQESLTAA